MPNLFQAAITAPVVSAAVSLPSAGWTDETVKVAMDFAEIVKLDRPADTIIIGNPGLLDATLSDSRTVVVNGKAAGTTNMIVLDEQGERIGSYTLSIVPPDGHRTTIYYGSRRQTFSCDETCTPVLSVGDENQYFQETQGQIQARQAAANGTVATE